MCSEEPVVDIVVNSNFSSIDIQMFELKKMLLKLELYSEWVMKRLKKKKKSI